MLIEILEISSRLQSHRHHKSNSKSITIWIFSGIQKESHTDLFLVFSPLSDSKNSMSQWGFDGDPVLPEPPPPSLTPPQHFYGSTSPQRFTQTSAKGELAALHSLGLAESNSTGCPALWSVHRRSSDVNHVRVHSLLHISLTPTRPLLASFPRCLKPVACCTLVSEILEKKRKHLYLRSPSYFKKDLTEKRCLKMQRKEGEHFWS